jgi:hypothetical protein
VGIQPARMTTGQTLSAGGDPGPQAQNHGQTRPPKAQVFGAWRSLDSVAGVSETVARYPLVLPSSLRSSLTRKASAGGAPLILRGLQSRQPARRFFGRFLLNLATSTSSIAPPSFGEAVMGASWSYWAAYCAQLA